MLSEIGASLINFKRTHKWASMKYEPGKYEGDQEFGKVRRESNHPKILSMQRSESGLFSTIAHLFPPIIPQNNTLRLISLQLDREKSIFAQSL